MKFWINTYRAFIIKFSFSWINKPYKRISLEIGFLYYSIEILFYYKDTREEVDY